ncbi:MAG: RNA polymerase sigma factor WhiG, partial [Actinomycetota bacterium]
MTKRTHGRESPARARGTSADGQRRTAELSDEATEGSVVASLWKEFKATADPSARERLILNYSPLVKYVAGRVSVGLPQNIEQADLVSYGIFGLIDAIEKF